MLFVFLFSVGLIWGCLLCREITRGVFVLFLQAHWGLSQYQPGRKSNHEARERAKGGKSAPDGDEKEPRGEMQGKKEAAGPGTNVAEGKTGTQGQRFTYFYYYFF